MAEDERHASRSAPSDGDALDPAPTAEELAAAAALRDELAQDRPDSELAALGVALRAAHAPKDLDAATHRELVDRAVLAYRPKARRSNVVRVVFGGAVASTLAMAAGALLMLRPPGGAPSPSAELTATRSTETLFVEPFQVGQTSARIDRIAMARSHDYRENRFRRWGVR